MSNTRKGDDGVADRAGDDSRLILRARTHTTMTTQTHTDTQDKANHVQAATSLPDSQQTLPNSKGAAALRSTQRKP